MISEKARRVQPWYRDRGVQASTVFTVSVTAFNLVAAESSGQQVYGILAVAPMLHCKRAERRIDITPLL